MCQGVSKAQTEKAKSQRPKNGSVKRYKHVYAVLNEKGKLVITSTRFNKKKWQPGENTSGRTSTSVRYSKYGVGEVERAIHVWTSKRRVAKYDTCRYLMEVECLNSDLIGVTSNGKHETYTRVFLKQKEYDRIYQLALNRILKNLASWKSADNVCGLEMANRNWQPRDGWVYKKVPVPAALPAATPSQAA